MTAFIASFLFVALAEMGDKTQLLAMAFASKYSVSKVIAGVFLATLLTLSLAVALGKFLTSIIPFDIISFAAAFSFIVFGLWTLKGDKLEEEEKRELRFGAVVTVGIAFFLAEMGDKTQLATVSLAVKYSNPFAVLAGTTLGMVAADFIGIIFGIMLAKKVSEKTIKYISSSVFVLFGLSGIYNFLSPKVSVAMVVSILAAVCLTTAFSAYTLISKPGLTPSGEEK